MRDKVPNQALLDAGISLLQAEGQHLRKIPTQTRAMIYELAGGEKVRVRTCNDHILVVLADGPELDAKLNIEGTDYLLIVMPETPRAPGPVVGYLVPTTVAVEAVRRAHSEWLASSPATKGNNRTWNLWFDDGQSPAGGFARKWREYRLAGSASTVPLTTAPELAAKRTQAASASTTRSPRPLGDVIAEARRQIAEAAGVPIDAVKISVNLT